LTGLTVSRACRKRETGVRKEREMANAPHQAEEAVGKLLEVLEETWYPHLGPTLKEVEELAQELFPGTDPKGLAEGAFKEARAWTTGVLEALFEDLGVIPSERPRLLQAVERGLGEGLPLYARCASWKSEGLLAVTVGEEEEPAVSGGWSRQAVPLGKGGCPGSLWLRALAGQVEARTAGGLRARKGRAFLRVETLEEALAALEEVWRLPSFFAALGLEGLAEALEALAELKEGEVRREGAYVLAREGIRVLLRGTLFKDPSLDAAFLLGREVLLPYPEGAGLAFRARLDGAEEWIRLEFSVRWGEESVDFERAMRWEQIARGSLVRLVREALGREAGRPWVRVPPTSRGMQALVEELAEAEDPLEAPKDPEFFRRVRLRALSAF
jgi:hypothetical protein